MRLIATGLFVRSARTFRLRSSLLPAPIADTISARSASTNSVHAATPFGDRHHPQRTQRRWEPKTDDAAAVAKQTFLKSLEEDAEDQKIITDASGLSGTKINNQTYIFDETSNLSPAILDLVGRNLYTIPNHPLCITRRLIESVFKYPQFKNHIATEPIVTIEDNFDRLGFPKDHPGRSRTDTYYVNAQHVLRTHSSAHQHAAFEYMASNPEVGYTICADVYRRDSIDRSHFPVFHQMECAHLWKIPPRPSPNEDNNGAGELETKYSQMIKRNHQIENDILSLPDSGLTVTDDAGDHNDHTNPIQVNHDKRAAILVGRHLKRSLEILVARVFTAAKEAGVGADNDEPVRIRWIEAYFPFTSPSWELEVWWQGEWLELLGCGVVQQNILTRAGLEDRIGWAWGLGIERLAMLLFGIPDIRLFWSKDSRFLNQFQEGVVTCFKPFSKYPACHKDVAFWLPSTSPTATPLSASASSLSSTSPGVAQAAGGDATKSTPKPTPTQSSSPSSTPAPASPTSGSEFHENDFMELVRNVAGELAEDVKLIDEFVQPTSGKKSLCYRIHYRSLEKTLTNEEANELHQQIQSRLVTELGVTLR